MSKHSRNVIFIGGIHGVGKSYLCRKFCKELGYEHLIASELIKGHASDLEFEAKHKQARDIESNQDILVRKLQDILVPSKHYLLDGHFSLFDSKGNIQLIPISTFQAINPSVLIVLTNDPLAIKNKLKLRDNLDYDINTLKPMQSEEIEHSERVAKKLGLKVYAIDTANREDLRCALMKHFS